MSIYNLYGIKGFFLYLVISKHFTQRESVIKTNIFDFLLGIAVKH